MTLLPLDNKQLQAYTEALKHKEFLLYAEQGTGKTLISLALLAKRVDLEERPLKVLVVGPLSALDVWEQDLNKFKPFQYELVKIESKAGKRIKELPQPTRKTIVATVNYESLVARLKLVSKWSPDFIIADESQAIKDRTSKRSKAMHKLGVNTTYKLALSGTPIDESIIDLWSQFRFVCPEHLGTWKRFSTEYCRKTGYGYTKWVIRKSKLPELIKLVSKKFYRITKRESIKDLGKLKFIKVYVTPDTNTKALYDKLEEHGIVKVGDATIRTPIVLTKISKLQQLTSGFIIDEDEETHLFSKVKIRKLKALLKRFDSEKVVVFCRYKQEVLSIKQLCKKLGRPYFAIHGGVDRESRLSKRQKFKNKDKPYVMICQIRTGGVGINEFVVANKAIVFSTTASWIDHSQAVSRLHRRGQTNDVGIYHILMRDTIDELIYEIIKQKGSLSKLVLNYKRSLYVKTNSSS